jgi:hypothetical protein
MEFYTKNKYKNAKITKPRSANERYLQPEQNSYKNQHTTLQNNTHHKTLVINPKLSAKQFQFSSSTKTTNYNFMDLKILLTYKT